MGRVEISKEKLGRLVKIINGAECNCQEIKIPLCGRCQIQKGIILDIMEAKKSIPFKPCGKEFEFMEADNVYKAICGGEDGLCDECDAVHAFSETEDKNAY